MLTDILLYGFLLIFSFAVGLVISYREIKHNGCRHFYEDTEQINRQVHDTRRLNLHELALWVRDNDAPVVSEILERTKEIRNERKRNRVSGYWEVNGMSETPGITTRTETYSESNVGISDTNIRSRTEISQSDERDI